MLVLVQALVLCFDEIEAVAALLNLRTLTGNNDATYLNCQRLTWLFTADQGSQSTILEARSYLYH